MSRNPVFNMIRALRPKQWTKNVVVLAAFFFALGDRQQNIGFALLTLALQAAALFCVVSSAIYLFNDIRDVEQDRAHPTKRLRPIAAGELSIPAAWVLCVILLGAGLSWAFVLSRSFFIVLAGYAVLQIVYSLLLKHVALVDMFVIATGFVLRALAGAVVLHVTISPWLLLCTLLLALFLALCKRRHEKVVLRELSLETRRNMDQYNAKLLDQLIVIVSSTTLMCYTLYTLWPDTIAKFGTPLLGLTIPFVIFGLFRYLDLVYRHEKGDRPEQILLTDVPLLIDLALYGATILAILLFGR